jgi:hypothetical protein
MLKPSSMVRRAKASGVGRILTSLYTAHLWCRIPVPNVTQTCIAVLAPTRVVRRAVPPTAAGSARAARTAFNDALVGWSDPLFDLCGAGATRLEQTFVVSLAVTTPG